MVAARKRVMNKHSDSLKQDVNDMIGLESDISQASGGSLRTIE